MTPMPKELFYALIAREGIKVALELFALWQTADVVTPEMLERLRVLGSRTAADYEREKQT